MKNFNQIQISKKINPPVTHLLNIDSQYWTEAKVYFANHPEQSKFSIPMNVLDNDDNPIQQSFIKIDDNIYAIKPGEPLGIGTFAKVRIVQDENNINYVVKIEAFEEIEKLKIRFLAKGISEHDFETIIRKELDFSIHRKEVGHKSELKKLEELGYFKGYMIRYKENGKHYLKNIAHADYKTYTLQTLHPGMSLLHRINHFSLADNLEVVKNIINEMAYLHSKWIIHRDIKPANFLVDEHNNVTVIDFGLSKKIRNSILLKDKDGNPLKEGSGNYIAPESIQEGKYSFATDIYALGVLFKNDLRLEELQNETLTLLISKMMATDPMQRPTIEEVLSTFNAFYDAFLNNQLSSMLMGTLQRLNQIILFLKEVFKNTQAQQIEFPIKIDEYKEKLTHLKRSPRSEESIKEEERLIRDIANITFQLANLLPQAIEDNERALKNVSYKKQRIENILTSPKENIFIIKLAKGASRKNLKILLSAIQHNLNHLTTTDLPEAEKQSRKLALEELQQKMQTCYAMPKDKCLDTIEVEIPYLEHECKYLDILPQECLTKTALIGKSSKDLYHRRSHQDTETHLLAYTIATGGTALILLGYASLSMYNLCKKWYVDAINTSPSLDIKDSEQENQSTTKFITRQYK